VTDVQDILGEAEANDARLANDLQRAKQAIAGPVPLIPDAGSMKFILPRGLYHSGIYKTEVTLRELTGLDEETLAKQKEVQDFFDTVIALGVKSVDDLDLEERPLAERRAQLRELLIGEREQLFLAVSKATFGNSRETGFRCVSCEAQQEMTILLDEDFPAAEIEGDFGPFTYTTSKGQVLTYRLATGEDQREALMSKGASSAEQNTTILSLCITKVNGGLIPDPLNYVRNLTMRDRSELLRTLVDKQPAVNLEVTTNCASCGFEQPIRFGWGDIFRS
jgi:hypothetical protein